MCTDRTTCRQQKHTVSDTGRHVTEHSSRTAACESAGHSHRREVHEDDLAILVLPHTLREGRLIDVLEG